MTLDWQNEVADTIVATEKDLPNRHLIAQNIANGKAEIKNPHPAVSIFNFHYASPPDTVSMNWKLRKPIGFDETGFQGTRDRVYRRQAWEFLMAGGAVFSNLDCSFTPEHEDGSARVEDPTPGGGGRELRKQLGIMKDFLERFDLVNAAENNAIVATTVPDGLRSEIRALSDRSRSSWGVYVPRGPSVELGLELPSRFYHVEWIDPRDGKVLKAEDLDARGGITTGSGLQPRGDRNGPESPRTTNTTRVVIRSPDYAENLAVRITARDPHER